MSEPPVSTCCSGRREASALKSPLSTRLREPLTHARFQQLFGAAEQEPELPAGPRLPGLCRQWKRQGHACSGPGVWRLLLARLPPLRWLPHYRWRAWLLGDAVAGVTVGIVHVPQGMAFAFLTSVPPVFGLYTSFFPVLIYSLLGTGRHLSTGTFAVLSLMTGSAVEQLVPEPFTGNLSGIEREQLEAQRVGAAAAVAFGSGALMLGMFLLQLGVLSTLLSEPVVKALTSGAALHVLVSQLPSLLGLSLPRQIGCFSLFKTLAAVFTALPQSSPAELTISALSLALLVPVKELNVRFRDRLPTPIPGEVVMVLLASVLCFTSSLDTRYNVQVVGLLPGGFPQPLLPNLAELPRILADSLPIALVTFAVSTSLASIYADKYSYSVDPNQELLAHGVSNLISSLFSCFPNSATLATTSLLVDAGGNTQLAGLFSCAVVLSVLLWLGPFFYYLPKAVLACINISSMRQMFFQMQELPQLWHISRVDFVRNGITPGLPPSTLSLSWTKVDYPDPKSFNPHASNPQTSYISQRRKKGCNLDPSELSICVWAFLFLVVVLEIKTRTSCILCPLSLKWHIGLYPTESVLSSDKLPTFSWATIPHHLPLNLNLSSGKSTHICVLQAVWMVTWVAVVTLNVDLGLAVGVVFSMMMVVCRTQRVQCLALGLAEGTELYRPLRESYKLLQVPGLRILSYPTPLYFATRGQFRQILEWHLGLGERSEESPKPGSLPDKAAEPVRVVILDFSGITFADAAGAREVVQLTTRCQDAGICLLLAQCNAVVLETLTRAGLLDRVTPEQLFVSVQDAAAHAMETLELTGPKICTVWI